MIDQQAVARAAASVQVAHRSGAAQPRDANGSLAEDHAEANSAQVAAPREHPLHRGERAQAVVMTSRGDSQHAPHPTSARTVGAPWQRSDPPVDTGDADVTSQGARGWQAVGLGKRTAGAVDGGRGMAESPSKRAKP